MSSNSRNISLCRLTTWYIYLLCEQWDLQSYCDYISHSHPCPIKGTFTGDEIRNREKNNKLFNWQTGTLGWFEISRKKAMRFKFIMTILTKMQDKNCLISDFQCYQLTTSDLVISNKSFMTSTWYANCSMCSLHCQIKCILLLYKLRRC